MPRGQVVVQVGYGRHGGQAKTGGSTRGQTTAQFVANKSQYAEGRGEGEHNPLYLEGGEALEGWRDARDAVMEAADRVQAESERDRAYIVDVMISSGDERIDHEDMHAVAASYAEGMRERGYQVEGFSYAIHDNGDHTHLHAMYASDKTPQKGDLEALKNELREVTDHAKEATLERAAQLERSFEHSFERSAERAAQLEHGQDRAGARGPREESEQER